MPARAVDAAAEMLWELWSTDSKLHELPDECRPVSLADGWAVQRSLDRLIGEPVGWKVAASSPAGQQAIGVQRPLVGSLHSVQLVDHDCVLPVPTIGIAEAEFVFRLRRGFKAADAPYSRETILADVESVQAALEVPDSRLGAYPQLGAAQLVADFMCARWLVVGPELVGVDFTSLRRMSVTAARGADIEATGSGADVLGDPCDALVWLMNEVAAHGTDVVPEAVVTTGACAWVSDVRDGDVVTATFGGTVAVTIGFSDQAEIDQH